MVSKAHFFGIHPGRDKNLHLQILHGVIQLSCPLTADVSWTLQSWMRQHLQTLTGWLSSPAASHLWWIQWPDRGSVSSLARFSIHRKVNRYAEWVLMSRNGKSALDTSRGHIWTSVSNVLLIVVSTHGNGVNHNVTFICLSSAFPQGHGICFRASGKHWMAFLVLLHLPVVWFLHASHRWNRNLLKSCQGRKSTDEPCCPCPTSQSLPLAPTTGPYFSLPVPSVSAPAMTQQGWSPSLHSLTGQKFIKKRYDNPFWDIEWVEESYIDPMPIWS